MSLAGLVAYDSDDGSEASVREPAKSASEDQVPVSPARKSHLDIPCSDGGVQDVEGREEAEGDLLKGSGEGAPTSASARADSSLPLRDRFPLLFGLPTKEDRLPPKPEAIQNILDYQSRNVTEHLRSNKQFGNPYILTKIVDQLKINEIGSNYPKDRYDPRGYIESDYVENISRRYSRYTGSATAGVGQKASMGSSGSAFQGAVDSSAMQASKKRSRWGESSISSAMPDVAALSAKMLQKNLEAIANAERK